MPHAPFFMTNATVTDVHALRAQARAVGSARSEIGEKQIFGSDRLNDGVACEP
jgi:hypothetical protein